MQFGKLTSNDLGIYEEAELEALTFNLELNFF